MLFSTLGLILMIFAGFSAAFIWFALLFGNKGLLLQVVKTGNGAPAAAGAGWVFPINVFPAPAAIGQPVAANNVGVGDVLDIQLTVMGQIFILGGSLAALAAALLAFLSPTALLNTCCINKSCLPKECCPAPACAAPMAPAPAVATSPCGCGA